MTYNRTALSLAFTAHSSLLGKVVLVMNLISGF